MFAALLGVGTNMTDLIMNAVCSLFYIFVKKIIIICFAIKNY